MRSDPARSLRLWRAHELLGSAGVAPWAAFHVYEQWSAFGGQEPFVETMTSTSHGAFAVALELALGIGPLLAWIALELRLRLGGPEPEDLRHAMAEDTQIARRLGLVARVGSIAFFAWALFHVGWAWLPKLLQGSDPAWTWLRVRDGLGTWPHATAAAIGLTAFAVHVWASAPRLAIALGWVSSPEGRRAARLSGLILGAGFLVLYAQLAGWHAAGVGTFWELPGGGP